MANDSNVTMTEAQMSAIDRAIAAAKARKAAKEANQVAAASETTDEVDQTPVKVAPKSKPVAEKVKKEKKVVDKKEIEKAKAAKKAARAESKAKIEKEREERKAAKAAEREAKKASKVQVTNVEPKHMAKVKKAEALLPKMDAELAEVFESLKARNMSEGQVTTLCAHLAHYNRVRATIRSASCTFEEGQTVEIISSDRDARLIGKRGTIVQVRKIRVLVDVGTTNPAYLFLSDIVAVEEEAVSETTDEVDSVEEESTETEVVTDETNSEECEFLSPDENEEVTEEEATGTDNV